MGGLGLLSECPFPMYRDNEVFDTGHSACSQDMGSTCLLGSLGLFEGQCVLETGLLRLSLMDQFC